MAKVSLEAALSEPRSDLPQDYVREIGRIVTLWAFLEHIIQSFAWELAGVGQQIGMLAIREPRASDRLQMIVDLAAVRGLEVKKSQITAFKNDLVNIGSNRDLVAHGVWTKHPHKGWAVVLARGNYPNDVDTTHRNRKIAPEGIPLKVSDLKKIAQNVELAIGAFRSLRRHIREKLPSSAGTRRE